MARILILGGYGVFGGRLARLLLRDGHEVIVAGRSRTKAEAFCAEHGGEPLMLDRAGDLSALGESGADLVVDATGPFQTLGSDPYRVAYAAIAAGMHCFDFSDDPEFTAGITALDAEARAAGVTVFSGVSTMPAITGAAATALADGLDVTQIESALLPGNRAPRGRAVIGSILAQAGEPLRIRRGGRWEEISGFEDRRVVPLEPGLERPGSLIGAPDLALFPKHFGAETVLFRAGLELGLMHRGLGVIAWLRKRRLLPRLTLLTVPIHWAAVLLKPFGTGTGGMAVIVTGRSEGRTLRRQWSVIAEGGDGPFVPAIPARVLAGRLDTLEPGARACVDEIPLDALEAGMEGLQIRFPRFEEEVEPLFPRHVSGFHDLPPEVRALHNFTDMAIWTGTASIENGRGVIPALIRRLFGFPAATTDTPVRVVMERRGDTERWTRTFGKRKFRSHLRWKNGAMHERFGPTEFALDLTATKDALAFPVASGRVLGLPIPRFLLPKSVATERAGPDGKPAFDVALHAPLGLGLIVRYKGTLSRLEPDDPSG
ncbi:SDR family oxidoreductase [Pontivivens ytuae]|uniref:DUF4166 domain-containing protein n=1 Tax=Pontivivens ytuae TaxID=2789856 RepID=A0A7S9LUJ9_9RHOB|nr:SDR family oxidoreductase [Pontivivens ytuae]QPH55514.1 DUF4166 domain-containing protein [Pontivivens ytuae]